MVVNILCVNLTDDENLIDLINAVDTTKSISIQLSGDENSETILNTINDKLNLVNKQEILNFGIVQHNSRIIKIGEVELPLYTGLDIIDEPFCSIFC